MSRILARIEQVRNVESDSQLFQTEGDGENASAQAIAVDPLAPSRAGSVQAGGFVGNLTWSVGGFFVSMLSTVLLTPYMIRRLGLEAYGIVALVMNSAAYLTILTNVINPVAGKYFVASCHGKAEASEERAFSTILLANLAICAMALGFIGIFTNSIADLLGVP